MTKTTTTLPDGSQIVTKTERGPGCCAWFLLLIFVALIFVGPAEYFPRWGAILAYVAEGILVIGVVAAAIFGPWNKGTLGGKFGHRVTPTSPSPSDPESDPARSEP
ncbi:MAG: hypothetical protein WBF51_04225 [Candidatus Dormiibacterota bacterium]